MGDQEIAEELGLSTEEVGLALKPRGKRVTTLNGDAWRKFIDDHLTQDPDGYRLFAGAPITDQSLVRALHRWTEERSSPDFWAADRFLCRFGLHIDDFIEDWCREHHCSPWAKEEPRWHRMPEQ
jgi:hypothetical protein